jgi:hypothetical protein
MPQDTIDRLKIFIHYSRSDLDLALELAALPRGGSSRLWIGEISRLLVRTGVRAWRAWCERPMPSCL